MKLEREMKFTEYEKQVSRQFLINEIEWGFHKEIKKENIIDSFDKFYDKLSLEYGLTYDEIYSLVKYFSSEAFSINDYLRRNQIPDKFKELIFNLDNAIKKLPSYDGILYRGIDIDNAMYKDAYNEVLSVFNNDEKIGGWKSFLSVSDGLYSTSTRLILIIKSKTAKYTFDFKKENGYSEFLFPRNTQFKFDDMEILNLSGSDYAFVYISEI